MKAEVDRLRERTKVAPGFPAPSRDPFNFGRRPGPPRQSVAVVAPVPEIRQVILPELVAILAEGTGPSAKRVVVFSRGDNVDFVNVGETVGAFRVDSVIGDAVTLVDSTTGARYRLALAN